MTNKNQAVDHTREELKQEIHDYKDDLLAIADKLERRALAASKAAAARSPKPPTLKELAFECLDDVFGRNKIDDSTYYTIRRALKALPE